MSVPTPSLGATDKGYYIQLLFYGCWGFRISRLLRRRFHPASPSSPQYTVVGSKYKMLRNNEEVIPPPPWLGNTLYARCPSQHYSCRQNIQDSPLPSSLPSQGLERELMATALLAGSFCMSPQLKVGASLNSSLGS